jgi:hypothetical protein
MTAHANPGAHSHAGGAASGLASVQLSIVHEYGSAAASLTKMQQG